MKKQTNNAGFLRSLVRTALVGLAGLTPVTVQAATADEPATTFLFAGTHRDFRAATVNKGGHPDFEAPLPGGRGVYVGIAADTLDGVGAIHYASTGHKVAAMATDSDGRWIIGPKPYLTSKVGDTPCLASPLEGKAVTSDITFGQWFNDTVAAMGSQIGLLPFTSTNGRMVYDGFPKSDIAGVTGVGGNKSWGYTYELQMDFVHDASRKDVIVAGADDALWVYLDGKLIIDLGGSHDYAEQVFEVNRMNGLVDGERYRLTVFYAEREKSDSRLKIDTTLPLNGLAAPKTSGHND